MEFLFHTNVKKELFCALCALLLLLATATSAEEGANAKNSQCHNYAGGHVYPGEAFRVPVSDHSLHLSKAKSEFLCCSLVSVCVKGARTGLLFLPLHDRQLQQLQRAAPAVRTLETNWQRPPAACVHVWLPYSLIRSGQWERLLNFSCDPGFCRTRHSLKFSLSSSPPPLRHMTVYGPEPRLLLITLEGQTK